MKKVFQWFSSLPLMALLLMLAFTAQKTDAQGVEVSYQTFYDDLSPYGQWVSDAQYGNVWIPNDESAGFRPYATNGHWVMTDYGNTWVSDDPWGWACYHYGRWTYNSYYGWVWVPGYDWAPAWVSWRYGGGYCGWAPLGPGFGVDVAYNCPADWWIFVGPQYLYDPGFLHYWRGARYNAGYLRATSFYRNDYIDHRTNVRYNYGPRGADIERYSHHPVQVYHLSGMQRAGRAGISGHNINMYRPAVNRATIHSARPGHIVAGGHAIGRGQAMSSGHGATGFRAAAGHPAIGGGHPQGNTGHGALNNHAHTGFGSHGNVGAPHNNSNAGRMHNANRGGNRNMGNRPMGGMNSNRGGFHQQPHQPMGGGIMPHGGGGFHGGGGRPMGGGMPHGGGGGGFHGGGGHAGGGEQHGGGGGRR